MTYFRPYTAALEPENYIQLNWLAKAKNRSERDGLEGHTTVDGLANIAVKEYLERNAPRLKEHWNARAEIESEAIEAAAEALQAIKDL